ncbi:MAG: hypothetical protein GY953_26190, partial [bacterium]|nr:hypothetical protein [bacterium]
MRRCLWLCLLSAAAALAQQQPQPSPVNPLQLELEQTHLREVMAAAGNSQVDIIRAFEEHLREFPKSERRPMIERTIVKAALELNDKRRIVKYGKRLIERDDATFTVLEHVTRALLDSDDPKVA